MQPKTSIEYTPLGMKKIAHKLRYIRECAKGRELDPAFALELPAEIGLKLTNRCNLRCTHCFQWDFGGYHHTLDKAELKKDGDLPIKIIEELLEKTRSINSTLYLWGGEPTLYAHWNKLIDLLKNDPRDTVICTNGINLMNKCLPLMDISEYFNILISIEGPKEIHDKIRGENTYEKILENLKELLTLQSQNVYKGTLSVETVVSDELIPVLYDFCEYFESLGINTLFINFPWFIPEEAAQNMDSFFSERFNWLPTNKGIKNSWHSFDFRVSAHMIDELKCQIDKIMSKTWKMRLRFHPELGEDMEDFLNGDTKAAQKKTRCMGISNRIDVLPSGKITPCKKFPEFEVGNLNYTTLEEAWQKGDYKKFRETLNNELMGICSKCEILYANGI